MSATEHVVHDHGPTEGRGLDCAELVGEDGLRRGWCVRTSPISGSSDE